MLIPFVKMQAQGNDFVIIDEIQNTARIGDYPRLARSICAMHFGVGADGLVILDSCAGADFQMQIFNSDGSRAEMCGSALRCVTYYYCRTIEAKTVTIQTDSGLKTGIVSKMGSSFSVSVNMGMPSILHSGLQIEGFTGSLVDVGNLHFVTYADDFSDCVHFESGSSIEHHPAFAQPFNVQFATRISSTEIQIKIWEASCGATLACGTGATAAVLTGIEQYGLADQVRVNMPGGTVLIDKRPDGFWLSGEVTEVFRGEYLWKI